MHSGKMKRPKPRSEALDRPPSRPCKEPTLIRGLWTPNVRVTNFCCLSHNMQSSVWQPQGTNADCIQVHDNELKGAAALCSLKKSEWGGLVFQICICAFNFLALVVMDPHIGMY